MDREEMERAVQKIEATRREILQLFLANGVEANEALSLLSGMLIQFYCGLVEDNTRENFLNTLKECYDTFTLIHTESTGGLQ